MKKEGKPFLSGEHFDGKKLREVVHEKKLKAQDLSNYLGG